MFKMSGYAGLAKIESKPVDGPMTKNSTIHINVGMILLAPPRVDSQEAVFYGTVGGSLSSNT